jgi:hypothetical protein
MLTAPGALPRSLSNDIMVSSRRYDHSFDKLDRRRLHRVHQRRLNIDRPRLRIGHPGSRIDDLGCGIRGTLVPMAADGCACHGAERAADDGTVPSADRITDDCPGSAADQRPKQRLGSECGMDEDAASGEEGRDDAELRIHGFLLQFIRDRSLARPGLAMVSTR